MSGSTTPTTFTYTGHTVTYTVPTTGLYDILAFGAEGGAGTAVRSEGGSRFRETSPGGGGAEAGGEVRLTQGEVLTIAVGGMGGDASPEFSRDVGGGGGGGGSFVVGPDGTPLVIAGGGGGGGVSGGGSENDGRAGQIGTDGGAGGNGGPHGPGGAGGTDGTGGSGGDGTIGGGGGGGFKGSGGDAKIPLLGFPGGTGGGGYPGLQGGKDGNNDPTSGPGGFGGGGGGGGFGGGGGGGYSGGGGGGSSYIEISRRNVHPDGGGGGGGGSFDSGTNQVLVAGENGGNGDVVITPVTVTPAIAGTQASQPIADDTPIDPFAQVSITDPSQGNPTETVVVAPSSTANGTLSDPNQATDGSSISGGIFRVIGSPSAVTAALDGLVFTPTVGQVGPGQQVTTGFTISDTNSDGLSASDSTTSVVATAVGSPPTLLKPVLSYTVAEGQTLQGLYGQILANVKAVDPSDQAKLTISSIGEAGTAGFLYPDLAHQTLTYTADGHNPNKPTDSFTYTVAAPDGATVTGTVDVAITGRGLPTEVGTAGPDTLRTSGEFRPERLLGLDGNDTLSVVSNGLVGRNTYAFAGRGDDAIQVDRGGFGNVIFGGPGTNTVTLDPVSASTTIVLQQGGVDEITGFGLSKGDVLNLRQAPAESQLNLGGDFAKLGNYATVTDNGNDATLSFNPQGLASGPGSPLAVLHGVGPGVTLGTLISDHALAIT